MKRVAISELKASLSEYLSGVRSGEELIITDRGIGVARLSPIAERLDAHGTLAELARAGLVRLPENKPAPLTSLISGIKDKSGKLRQHLEKEREGGW